MTKMEIHPPWADELLARNRKVARAWSTSLDESLRTPSPDLLDGLNGSVGSKMTVDGEYW